MHLTSQENDHVELGNARGFIGKSPHAAFLEIEAISKGTQAKQPFFHVIFNPPNSELVSNDQFYDAIDRLEKKLGLVGQPRFPIFHDKHGDRHCHCIWSRIDIDRMKAINMSFFKDKCSRLSRDLFIENGWKMPAGMLNREDKDPFNVFVGEFQRLQKQGVDPQEIKKLCREAWAMTDSLPSFQKAMEERGLFLARGDKRGFVILDHNKKVYSLSRYGGIKVKDLKAKLGEPDHLPTVVETANRIHNILNADIRQRIGILKKTHEEELVPYQNRKTHLVEIQRAERRELDEHHRVTRNTASKSSKDRFRRSMTKQFEQATQNKKRLRLVNRKGFEKLKRKQTESAQLMVFRHNKERTEVQKPIKQLNKRHLEERKMLSKEIYELRQVSCIVRGENSQISRKFNQVARLPSKVRGSEDKKEQGEKHTLHNRWVVRGHDFE